MTKQEQEIIKQHQERLQTLFQSQVWEDLKEEIQRCYDNADSTLHAVNNSHREIEIGECLGYKRVLDLENKFR